MIGAILSELVQYAETFADVDEDVLFAEERAAVGNAVPARRAEFATVRHCARQALGVLGISPGPLIPDPSGAPGWPEGVVGSMTHCAGFRAAVVARSSEVITIGIDAEPNAALPDDVLDVIALHVDHERLRRLPANADVAWDRALFSAKESVYKAWFPLTHRWLGFEEATVTLEPDGTFDARLLVPGPQVEGRVLTGFTGRWIAEADILATAIVLPVT